MNVHCPMPVDPVPSVQTLRAVIAATVLPVLTVMPVRHKVAPTMMNAPALHADETLFAQTRPAALNAFVPKGVTEIPWMDAMTLTNVWPFKIHALRMLFAKIPILDMYADANKDIEQNRMRKCFANKSK